MNLHSKCVIVTGGAMGIGLATSRRLIKEGCIVTIWDINREALQKAKAELESLNGTVFAHVCDVTDRELVYRSARKAEEEMGKVDILINNAGYVAGGKLLDQPDAEWEKTIDVNLTALLYTIRAVLPGMYQRNSGHIVNISSAAGTLGVGGLSVYAATKWAVWGLTESLRFEAMTQKKNGVRYSSIHPSYIAHGMFEGAKLGFLGNLVAPRVKDHDVIAKAIVESALKKGRYSPKRPRTVNLTVLLRGLLPDRVFQRMLIILGIADSMKTWHGREVQPKRKK